MSFIICSTLSDILKKFDIAFPLLALKINLFNFISFSAFVIPIKNKILLLFAPLLFEIILILFIFKSLLI